MVFDKQGRFIENLQRDQFELRVDGKPKPISFFERVKAGSLNEDAQLAAARGDARPSTSTSEAGRVVPMDRGRIVLFYVDDLHLSMENTGRVRKMLSSFIEDQMGQNDEAAIASASGQIGFLQQITNDKVVLRAALARLQSRNMQTRDFERPPMTALQALSIARYDQDVTDYFVDRFLADNPGFPRPAAIETVRRRGNALLQQSSSVTTLTLSTLNNMIKSAGELPGRKVLFVVSEGFLIDDQSTNISNMLRRIADSAARAGVVIYTTDARGLSTGIIDASSDGEMDLSGRLTRSLSNEITATQAPLRAMAQDTGGRALLNTNSLSAAALRALDETSTYYLIAWKPNEDQEENRFRKIEVSVRGRSDLTVRVRKGYFERDERSTPRPASTETRTAQKQTSEDGLLSAMQSRMPLTALPTTVFVSYADSAQTGTYITASMEVDSAALDFSSGNNSPSSTVDIAGVIIDDQGKLIKSFQNQLQIKPPANGEVTRDKRGIVYNFRTDLKPGLYQVRVASREGKSGRSGSAVQWIEVPNLATHVFSLGSLNVGEVTSAGGDAGKEGSAPDRVFMSVARRLLRNSRLRFLTQVYNAARNPTGDQAPDVALQVHIFRDNQPVMTTAQAKVQTAGMQDLVRIPYAADISLDGIPPGRYRLQVTAIDRIAKTSATQNVNFEIE
jgi:VWFA-related protein